MDEGSGLRVGDLVAPKKKRVKNGFSMICVGKQVSRDGSITHVRRVMLSFGGTALSVEAQARLDGGEPITWCGESMNEENIGYITIDAAIHPTSNRVICEACRDAIIDALMSRNDDEFGGWVDVPVYHEPDEPRAKLRLIKSDESDDGSEGA